MKKQYESLEMEVIRFDAEDVITTSTGTVDCSITDTPYPALVIDGHYIELT